MLRLPSQFPVKRRQMLVLSSAQSDNISCLPWRPAKPPGTWSSEKDRNLFASFKLVTVTKFPPSYSEVASYHALDCDLKTGGILRSLLHFNRGGQLCFCADA